jgi:hypothetical protein
VPIGERDVEWLYQAASAVPERWPRLCGRGTPSYPEFRGRLWGGIAGMYRVDAPVPGEPAAGRPQGMIGVYSVNEAAGVAWMERLDLPLSDRQLMDGALADVMGMAARAWGLRRLFFSYYDCVPSPLGEAFGPESHGRLRGHGFFHGTHWDLVHESVVVSA